MYCHITGPIIRINPDEIVVNDSEFYNTVYVASNTRRSEKWTTLQGTGLNGQHFPLLPAFSVSEERESTNKIKALWQ